MGYIVLLALVVFATMFLNGVQMFTYFKLKRTKNKLLELKIKKDKEL